jgi:hypothetical protein
MIVAGMILPAIVFAAAMFAVRRCKWFSGMSTCRAITAFSCLHRNGSFSDILWGGYKRKGKEKKG